MITQGNNVRTCSQPPEESYRPYREQLLINFQQARSDNHSTSQNIVSASKEEQITTTAEEDWTMVPEDVDWTLL